MEASVSVHEQDLSLGSDDFTEASKPALILKLEDVVLNLNRKGMLLLQRKKHEQAF